MSVYDNYAVSPGSDQHISVDALRLTWAGEDPPPTDPPPTDPPPSDGGTPGDGGTPPPSEDGGWPVDDAGTPIVDDAGGTAPDGGVTEPPPPRTRSGCSAGGGDPVGPAWLVMGLAVLGVMRRRRRRD
ncbi:MAG: hypothetical protein GWN85_07090 [Gemmatimonadetes bacterium]|nr:hypothetical protein [Gemmatimonadota bacterium]